MSHRISLQAIKVTTVAAEKAARHLGYEFRTKETVEFFDRSIHTGATVRLPGWKHPVVFQGVEGKPGLCDVNYDNYNNQWGNVKELQKFLGYSTLAMAKRRLDKVSMEVAANGALVMTSL